MRAVASVIDLARMRDTRLPFQVCIEVECRDATCPVIVSESATPTCVIFSRLFEVSDRPQGLANVERLIAAIELVGGDGRGYRRERAKAARAIIAEVYSPPRVTAAANRLPKYGMQPGLSLDITVNDETGLPYDFSIKAQRTKAEALIAEQQPMLLIGSPMCTAFSAIQAINNIPGNATR